MNRLEYILQNVSKPQQYIGMEYGLSKKPDAEVNDRENNVRFLMSFPDTYEIGMSNHAIKIVFEMLDRSEGVIADRAFIPGDDYAELSKKLGFGLASLNYGLPAAEFDAVGFTLEYELNYSNVLYFLELSKIPVLARERGEGCPVIVAGGSSCVNPAPLADFIDVFFAGDGEPMVPEIVAALKKAKAEKLSRKETVKLLSKIEGAWAPAEGECGKVRMRLVDNLDECFHPTNFLVPNVETVFNRGLVEIARGCPNACRFCQAGFIYRPYRERSAATAKKIAKEMFLKSGYYEYSLSSLSATDHSELREIVGNILSMDREGPEFAGTLFSVSLPSQRVSTFSVELAKSLAKNRKSGLTFAPEAGSQKMRDAINKNVTGEDLLATAAAAMDEGYSLIKLYFMIGLPFETDEDVIATGKLISEVMELAREKRKKGFEINVTLSTFVPKPHTPFQWARQLGGDEVRRRQSLLKKEIAKYRGVTIKCTDYEVSLLESAFARGGRELSPVLLSAHRLGCRFDAWGGRLRFDLWERAFAENGLNLSEYAQREFDPDAGLSWDMIDTGVSKAFLRNEYRLAAEGRTSPACDTKTCRRCGVCH